MDQKIEKEKKDWPEVNWKYFLLRGKQKKEKGIELWGVVSKQLHSEEGGMPPLLPGGVKRIRCYLAFLEGGIKVRAGGKQTWVYILSGWEQLREGIKDYYGKVEKEEGREFRSTDRKLGQKHILKKKI